jgi:hypothetical protein
MANSAAARPDAATWLASATVYRATATHLAACPAAPYALLGALTGHDGNKGAQHRVAALAARGLAATVALPRPLGSPLHLAYLTDAGWAALGAATAQDPTLLAAAGGGDARGLIATLTRGARTVGLYQALTTLVRAVPGQPQVRTWIVAPLGDDHPFGLPALAAVSWHATGPDGLVATRDATVALLADLPDCPPERWLPVLRAHLAGHTRAPGTAPLPPPVLLATTAGARGERWLALLDALFAEFGVAPGGWCRRDLVDVVDEAGQRLEPPGAPGGAYVPRLAPAPRVGLPVEAAPAAPPPALADEVNEFSRLLAQHARGGIRHAPWLAPAPRVGPPVTAALADPPHALVDAALATALPTLPALHLRASHWRLLEVIARAPFLRLDWLAIECGEDLKTVRRSLTVLDKFKLVCRLDPHDPDEYYKNERDRAAAADLCARHRLFEATLAGLTALADRAGSPLAVAAAAAGWAGGGPTRALGDRSDRATNLPHTDGVYGALVGVRLTLRDERPAAGEHPEEGRDDVRWHTASGYANWSMRPAAALQYRRGGRWHHAYVEYARGTEDLDAYRRTLAAYHHFEAYSRGRDEEPDESEVPRAILVIARRPAAEDHALAAARLELADAPHLRVLTTTTARLRAAPRGLLAAIWRTPTTGPDQHAWPAPVPSSSGVGDELADGPGDDRDGGR